MDNQQIISLAKSEDLQLFGDIEYFNKQLSDWLDSISEDFGDDTNE